MNVYKREPEGKAQACVIWMHGLGADSQNMMSIVDALPTKLPIRHVFIDAPIRTVAVNNHMPMRAWYNILGLKLTDREDSEGILHSEQLIHEVILKQLADGFSSRQIFLAGFSQGGAMALFAGLRHSLPLGGILALSAYLPLATLCQEALFCETPIFMAIGTCDPVVLPNWTKLSYNWLLSKEFSQVVWHEYPMEHSICMEETIDLARWLGARVSVIQRLSEGKE